MLNPHSFRHPGRADVVGVCLGAACPAGAVWGGCSLLAAEPCTTTEVHPGSLQSWEVIQLRKARSSNIVPRKREGEGSSACCEPCS